ncbi:caspase family protein [Rhizobium sp. 32-5/1]|uniref:caspase family protein n=1 Tax=Rhizobium sp. 32-5/1 TaxID=3019602 RepID=UPI00240D99A3|nr:caspase family protein [Rhizobium sp. 32-5/1]WEZ83605.1 caspase family protein [Rhizobium sp. 32-5/1]
MFRRILMAATLSALPLQDAAAETYALVVGVDMYPFESNLDGAVKDAEDVAAALDKAGITNVAKFVNEAASKDAIRTAWTELVEKAVKDDTIIFTYAGHGSQMPELVAGDEEDGLDEFLQLPGFDRARAAETDHEIIVDNEMNAWFAEAEAKGIRVLFVSDSCHSGGMSRSFSGKTRLAPAVTVKLPAPSEQAISGAKLRERDFRDVTVLAASWKASPRRK